MLYYTKEGPKKVPDGSKMGPKAPQDGPGGVRDGPKSVHQTIYVRTACVGNRLKKNVCNHLL